MRFTWIVFSVLVTACGTYHESYTPFETDAMRAAKFKTLSFEAVRETVFRTNCFECHSDAKGNSAGVNLERLADVRKALPSIIADLSSDKMPMHHDPISPFLKQIVIAWSNADAPETSNIPMPTPDSKPTKPKMPPPGFDQVSTRIFQPYCIRCHGNLADPAFVIKAIDKIQGAVDSDQMPKNSPKPLPQPLKELLTSWVEAKMPMGFDEVKQKLFVPYCIRCHGSFANYASVAKNSINIWAKVWSDEMPRNGDPVPLELKQLLDDWVKQGAPN